MPRSSRPAFDPIRSTARGDGNAETIVADGTDQPGVFGTTLSVTVEVSDALKVVRKEKGHMIITANWKLSKDGNTLTDDFTGINPNGSTYNLNYLYKRSGAGSGFAGTWLSTSEAFNSAFVLQVRSYEGTAFPSSTFLREQRQT